MENYPPESVSIKSCPSKGVDRLYPGEFMITCPYNTDHQVLNGRFYQHMEKCRRNYELKFKAKGQPPLKLTCKYNYEHEIYSPEIFFHEHGCPDKDKLFVEQLLMERKKINAILDGDFDTTKYEGLLNRAVDNDQLGPMGEQAGGFMKNLIHFIHEGEVGVFNNLDKLAWDLVNAGSVEKLLPFPAVKGLEDGKVLWADPNVPKEKIVPTSQSQVDLGKVSQTDDPLFHKRRRYTRVYRVPDEPFKKLASVEEEEDTDSEEYWAKTSNKRFDWYRHQFFWRPEGAMPMKYPPGLSKAQRKAFVKWNTERLKTEHGIDPDYGGKGPATRRAEPNANAEAQSTSRAEPDANADGPATRTEPDTNAEVEKLTDTVQDKFQL